MNTLEKAPYTMMGTQPSPSRPKFSPPGYLRRQSVFTEPETSASFFFLLHVAGSRNGK